MKAFSFRAVLRGGNLLSNHISTKVLWVWEMGNVLVFSLIALVIYYVTPYRSVWWYGGLWLTGFLFVLFAFLYLPLLQLTCVYQANEDYLEYRRGIFFMRKSRLAHRAVTSVSLVRSPFSVLTRTTDVFIRGMGANLYIPFLEKEEADVLAEWITSHGRKERG